MELFKQEGDTPRTIRAYVDHSGDVVLGSQDFPSEAMRGFVGGAREYEYWTQVPAAARDQLLIALLVERYQGNPNSVNLVVLDQAIDTTTPAGRLLFHMLAAISEFERDLIRDRVLAGLKRARLQGTRSGKRIGRPRSPVDVGRALELLASGQRSLRAVAKTLGVSAATVSRALGRASRWWLKRK